MSDPRTVLERELDRIDPRPFTLETFHRRRARIRRRQQRAALGVGVAVVVVTVLIIARSFASDPGRRAGDEPPTSRPGTTVRYESRLYGYALDLPESWEVRRASSRWTAGPLASGIADRFLDETQRVVFEIAAIRVGPSSMGTLDWLAREDRRHARLVGLASCDEGDHDVVPTRIDGRSGFYAPACELIALVVPGPRPIDRVGYVIRVHGDLSTRTDLRAIVESIRLRPREVSR